MNSQRAALIPWRMRPVALRVAPPSSDTFFIYSYIHKKIQWSINWPVGACLEVIPHLTQTTGLGTAASCSVSLLWCLQATRTKQARSWLFSHPGLQHILCRPFDPRSVPTALTVKSSGGLKHLFSTWIINTLLPVVCSLLPVPSSNVCSTDDH